MARDRHEVAVIADRLIDLGVVLLLVDLALVVEHIVVLGVAGREERLGATTREHAGVDRAEDAEEAIVADRPLQPRPELVERVARTILDCLASGLGGRASTGSASCPDRWFQSCSITCVADSLNQPQQS